MIPAVNNRTLNTKVQKYLLAVAVLLAATDLAILLDISGLREVLGFMFFTTVPGLLILLVLKLHRIEFLKKVVISVGLSVVFLMFGGLVVNSFYPLISKPLSLEPLLIAFNIMTLLLLLLAYWRNRSNFNIKDVLNFQLDLRGKLTSPVFFPFLFPLLSLLGVQLMNTQGNNRILLIMLALIPAYVIVLVMLRHKIPKVTYPVVIGMIGLALVLMHGLTSSHIMGRDIFGEYYVFQVTANNAHWNASMPDINYNACLSITVLPTIYQKFIGVGSEDTLRLVLGILLAFVPLVVFLISKNYLGQFYGFLASVLFIFQLDFVQGQQLSGDRYDIGVLFFSLAVLILLDREINILVKKGLFIVSSFAVIVSHYGSGYALSFWIFLLWILLMASSILAQRRIRRTSTDEGPTSIITWDSVLLTLIFSFFWFGIVTRAPLSAGVGIVHSTIDNLTSLFASGTRHETVGGLFGIGVHQIAGFLNMFAHDAIIFFICVGVLQLLRRYASYRREGFQKEYLESVFIFFVLLIAMIVIPYISTAYDPDRVLFTSLLFLAPALIIGGEFLARTIRRLSWLPITLCLLLMLQFVCVTSLQWHLFDIPVSPYYENAGYGRDEYYIYDGELAGAKWLTEYGTRNSIVYGDWRAWTRLLLGWKGTPAFTVGFLDQRIASTEFEIVMNFTDSRPAEGDYVYLRHVNVRDGQIYLSQQEKESLSLYPDYFAWKDKIYADKDAEVWIQ
jgi:uncharacterized membrane protein